MSCDTYAYCPACDKIVEANSTVFEPCITPDTPGRWAAAGMVCRECLFSITTLYWNLDEECIQAPAPSTYYDSRRMEE